MSKTKYFDFSKLETCDQLETYIEERICGHEAYYHYTSACAINEILKENCIFLSSARKTNDKKENIPNVEKNNKVYYLCFSTGKNENLSLWYLYSGIKGNGVRIRLTKANLYKLVKTSKYELWKCDENKKPVSKIKELLPEKDVKLELRDVIYARQSLDNKCYDLKYNNLTNYNNMSFKEFDSYKTRHIGFVKGIVWYYEKETRLLATLSDDITPKLEKDTIYVIKTYFDEKIAKEFKIQFAPEVVELGTILKSYPIIKDFMEKTSRISLSEYKGDIKMHLFDEEKYKKQICEHCPKNKE